MKNFEILAPVGADEQLKAAVRCGANAVYLGTSNFNARRNADNFDENSLKEAVKYCHLRNVKVYVALNTLIFDKELNELNNTITQIAKSGADAVIVQDFAVVQAVKKICPQLPLHASTQMAVHNVSGALLLQQLGFSRIVVARELSLDEIKAIREAVKVELEVFVHGAHCMSTSGNCYLSAMLGERSGNRGLCAQGCRLNWVSQHGREYALSLKDMSYLDSIKRLMDIGVESFKIEGRMKRPEYVAAAVTSLKNAINGQPYDKDTLRSVFSRSGFTDGYLQGKRDLSMFGYRVKDDVTSAGNVLKGLEQLYKWDIHPAKIDISLTLQRGKPSVLTAKSGNKAVTVEGAEGEAPRTAPLSQEIALRSISKLGDTPFFMGDFTFKNEDMLTLSASAINAMRREACTLLENALTETHYEIHSAEQHSKAVPSTKKLLSFRIRLQSISQYSPALSDAEFIIIPMAQALDVDKALIPTDKIIIELPALIYPKEEAEITKSLKKIKAMGITRAFVSNIGAVKLCSDLGFTVHGAHGLNITNSFALSYYKELGLADATLSFELTQKAMSGINARLPVGAYIYGYLPLMLMRVCPQKDANGCGVCNGLTQFTDRKGVTFPAICHQKKYTALYNSVPLYIGDKALNMLDFGVLYFTTEDKEACAYIYKQALKGKSLNGPKTNGLFNRELL